MKRKKGNGHVDDNGDPDLEHVVVVVEEKEVGKQEDEEEELSTLVMNIFLFKGVLTVVDDDGVDNYDDENP